MRLALFLALFLAAVARAAPAFPGAGALGRQLTPTPEALAGWLGAPEAARLRGMPVPELAAAAAARAREALGAAADPRRATPAKDQYPYFAFLGAPLSAALVPGAGPARWSNECFRSNTGQVTRSATTPGLYHVNITVAEPTGLLCSDLYYVATISGLRLELLFKRGTHAFDWTLPADATSDEQWDLEAKGLRVFAAPGTALDMVGSVLDTVALFYDDVVGPGVPDWVAELNHDFLVKYAPFEGAFQPRKGPLDVDIDEDQVQSGDFFGVMRLDGLDPLLGWAMGSATGHTTVALRDESTGELYVTESTVKDAYWPTGGIQRTPWKQWVAQVRRAGFNVVHAPLAAEHRARFNATAAWELFAESEGLEYGYHNLLFGWMDTAEDNFPCFPPDYRRCVSWDLLEVVIGLLGRLAPSLGDQIFDQAMNHRLGTSGLGTPAILREVARRGLDTRKVMASPELDEWEYRVTRYGNETVTGKSRVCCVWVCAVWKAAGLFGDLADEIQCTEQTNVDDYRLRLLTAPNPLPAQCQAADPENPLCQLAGRYSLILNDYAVEEPYARMHEHCPSQGPNYTRPAGC